jgi:uncharacterized LabA/DUF88 family protein
MSDRIALFLDGNYVSKGAANVLRLDQQYAKIDWQRLVSELVGDRPVLRAYYYDAVLGSQHSPDVEKLCEADASALVERFNNALEQRWKYVTALRYLPRFCVRLASLTGRYPRTRQKGVDTRITLDMLSLSHRNAFSTAILVSGDADLVEVVEAVMADGHRVELAHFPDDASPRLVQACDTCMILDINTVRRFTQAVP